MNSRLEIYVSRVRGVTEKAGFCGILFPLIVCFAPVCTIYGLGDLR